MRYRRAPSEIDAVQWTGSNPDEVYELAGENIRARTAFGQLSLRLRAGMNGAQGWVFVPVGHWVAKGGENDFWPIDPEAFARTYRPAPTRPLTEEEDALVGELELRLGTDLPVILPPDPDHKTLSHLATRLADLLEAAVEMLTTENAYDPTDVIRDARAALDEHARAGGGS